MAFTPFTETDQPTMANFNEKFSEAIEESVSRALAEGVKIATGSYTGTGTYGSSNPNSLTFDFEPKLIFFFDKNGNPAVVLYDSYSSRPVYSYLASITTDYTAGVFLPFSATVSSYTARIYAKMSEDRKTLHWYVSSGGTENAFRASDLEEVSLNVTGRDYNYVAIG